MKRFLLALMLVSGVAYGDTTSNLITNTWNNVTNGSHPNDCCTGGPGPLYDASTNTIHFSYGLTAVHQVQAINQALSGSGIQINGWNWGYDLRNMDGVAGNQNRTIDTISVTSFITNSAGQIVQQSDQFYNTQFDWTRYSGTVNLNSAIGIADAGSLGIQFVSRDNGYWGGYYGPQVRDVTLTANYSVDQCAVNPQSSPSCPGFRTYYQMYDDGYAVVPLPFTFPFYGQNFTTSAMFTNGVVGFLDNNWGYCCDGVDLNGQAGTPNSPWNFAIYALNTDLYPGQNSLFYTQQTDNGTGLKYTWENVVEIGTNRENTFSVQIKDSGYIGINYTKVDLNSYRNPLIGIAGDISQGQYSQYYYGSAANLPNIVNSTITYTGTETTDVCAINPLYNTSCSGYAEAYHNYQCAANPLYATTCSGYAAAYYTQQCSINSLYDPGCPGYAAAYLDYQCSLSALYSTTCPGYEQAYFDQQCALDGLYSNQCPNYAEAYALANVVPATSTPTTVSTTEVTPTVSLDGTVKTEVSTTGNSTVDSVISTTTVSATPSSATATVQLAPTTSSTATTTAQVTEQTTEAKTDDNTQNDTKTEDTQQASSSSSSESNSGESKTKSAKAEARKEAIAKAGKQAAENMDSAASMQAQVAVQGVVIAAMGYTPGFDAYKFMIPDAPGYKPFEIYKKQKNVDNGRMLRGLTGASDNLHDQMVMEQYR